MFLHDAREESDSPYLTYVSIAELTIPCVKAEVMLLVEQGEL